MKLIVDSKVEITFDENDQRLLHYEAVESIGW